MSASLRRRISATTPAARRTSYNIMPTLALRPATATSTASSSADTRKPVPCSPSMYTWLSAPRPRPSDARSPSDSRAALMAATRFSSMVAGSALAIGRPSKETTAAASTSGACASRSAIARSSRSERLSGMWHLSRDGRCDGRGLTSPIGLTARWLERGSQMDRARISDAFPTGLSRLAAGLTTHDRDARHGMTAAARHTGTTSPGRGLSPAVDGPRAALETVVGCPRVDSRGSTHRAGGAGCQRQPRVRGMQWLLRLAEFTAAHLTDTDSDGVERIADEYDEQPTSGASRRNRRGPQVLRRPQPSARQ